jgi:hypothetical protein
MRVTLWITTAFHLDTPTKDLTPSGEEDWIRVGIHKRAKRGKKFSWSIVST